MNWQTFAAGILLFVTMYMIALTAHEPGISVVPKVICGLLAAATVHMLVAACRKEEE